MSQELEEGAELESIVGYVDGEGGQLVMSTTGQACNCERIVVSMQPGQMAMVPWARCEMLNNELRSGGVVMMNLAFAETVKLKGDE